MARLRYGVASTLDGFIASSDHTTDWIVDDPSIDFDALYAEFDIFVMGRKTFEVMTQLGNQSESGESPLSGREVVVISRTMKQDEHPQIRVVGQDYLDVIRELKARSGVRDIWLMGGGTLAWECLEAGLLDAVETAIMPVVIWDGIKLIAPPEQGQKASWKLHLTKLDKLDSGILWCKYDVVRG